MGKSSTAHIGHGLLANVHTVATLVSDFTENQESRALSYIEVRKSQGIVRIDADGFAKPASQLSVSDAIGLLDLNPARSHGPDRRQP
jgi:hypothetical protein